MPDTLRLEILTIERQVFDDEVAMVIAPAAEGLIGVLPHHSPLLTTLDHGELEVRTDSAEPQFFAIGGGFLQVLPDHVVVLADLAEHADEIDLEQAEDAHRRAEELVAERQAAGPQAAEEAEDLVRARAALRRSQVRVNVARRRGSRRTVSELPGALDR